MHERLVVIRPDPGRNVYSLLPDPDLVHRRRAPAARTIRDGAGGRDDGAFSRMLDVVNRFLVIVAAKNQINTNLRKATEDLVRAFEPVSLRQLALHWIVMHDDHSCIVRRSFIKGFFCFYELI